MTCFSSADESAHYGFSVCMLLEHYRAQLRWERGRRRRARHRRRHGDRRRRRGAAGPAGAQLRHQRVVGRGRPRQHRRARGRRPLHRRARRLLRPGRRRRRAAGRHGHLQPAVHPGPRPATSSCPSSGAACTATTSCCSCSRPATTTSSPPSPATPTRRRRCAPRRTSATGWSTSWPWALDYGRYSSEPKVRDAHPAALRRGRGWAGDDEYMVAVALFTRNPDIPGDRADQLLKACNSDRRAGPEGSPRRGRKPPCEAA